MHSAKKVYTVMVINSTNIKKTNNHLIWLNEHEKDDDIWRWNHDPGKAQNHPFEKS